MREMIRYLYHHDLLPLVEVALAAEDYIVDIPWQR